MNSLFFIFKPHYPYLYPLKLLVIITGPTAIGKTAAAIQAARHFNTEIISADSRQIYRELTIGTAVPGPSELEVVKHHFIHTHSIREPYNASRYETEAIDLIDNLFKKHDVLIMTGGSMLYIDAVCNGIDEIPDADPEIRNTLKNRLKAEGIENLRLQLKVLDPEYYTMVDLKNPARIIHALEICLTTGRPYSSYRKSTPKHRNFVILKTALNCERAELHARINKRVDEMVAGGLEQEALKVYPLKHLTALNTVGYREFFDYFEGTITLEKAKELIKRNTRRYARKQITWFRKDPAYSWFSHEESEELIKFIEKSIQ